jgi:uncharacterized protein YegP (UPF0339 family)
MALAFGELTRPILADSSEGYLREQECVNDIERVKGSADAP